MAEPGTLELTANTQGYQHALLSFAGSAVAAHSHFVFDTEEEARAFLAFTLNRGVADFGPPAGRLLLVNGTPAGLLAVLSPQLLQQRRITSALAVARHDRYGKDRALRERLQLGARALCNVRDDTAYLSCLAIDGRFAGQGLGRWLLRQAHSEAARLGLSGVMLDVAAENRRAINLYTRSGYTEVGRASVQDAATGRSVTFCHLAVDLPSGESADSE